MNPLTLNQKPSHPKSDCVGFARLAERELAAFSSAVTELFGSEQAVRSAEDWLDELGRVDDLPASAREWRSITAKAARRLASRVQTLALNN